jgi:hypothetical protein
MLLLAFGVCQIILSASIAAAATEVVVLRSGNAAIGFPDPYINVMAGSCGIPLSPNPFTAADFDAACAGHSAMVVAPYPGIWLPQLDCDPQAQWIGIDMNLTAASALYCYNFNIETCCIDHASLQICWAADDTIGDAVYGGPNPDGVYLNGTAVSPSISGGSYATESQAGPVDVTSLVHCGSNQLVIYDRDAGCGISGLIFSAQIDIDECITPTGTSDWSTIKALYN